MDNSVQPEARAAMLGLISGFHISRALYIAARLKLADLVCHGAVTCTDLAAHTGVDASALYRVVRVLANAGVFELGEHGQVLLTPLSETLLSDAPGGLAAWAITQIGDDPYRAWGALMYGVRTGDVAFDHVYGCDCWQYRADHPESAKDFDDGMVGFTGIHDEAVIASYPFADLATVVDVGGGEGRLLTALLKANPHMKGILFDQARVIKNATTRIAQADLLVRCQVVAGNFFETIPNGGDAYILSRVLHDWYDDAAIAILRNCRAAMPSGARLLLIERIVPPRIDSAPGTRAILVSDLHMMVMNGGQERTEVQYRILLEAAGLKLTRVVPAGDVISIIEAMPA